jgi:hypothetical protein
MSVLTTNQSNIEMRTVEDLTEGDVIIHTEVKDGSVGISSWVVTDTTQPNTYGGSTGITYCNVELERQGWSLRDNQAHPISNELKTQTFMMNRYDTVAVVVSA